MSNANASAHSSEPSPPITLAERSRAMQVAAVAGCDVRTALRALREGAESIRTLAVRERVTAAIREVDAR